MLVLQHDPLYFWNLGTDFVDFGSQVGALSMADDGVCCIDELLCGNMMCKG
jgi:hypothetical protein